MAEREEGEEERPRQKREREDELERWQRRQAKLCCSLRSLGEKEQAVEPTMRLREKVKREVPSASREKKSENAKAEFEKEREKKNCISTNVFFFSPSKPEAESERASSARSLARSPSVLSLHQRETPARDTSISVSLSLDKIPHKNMAAPPTLEDDATAAASNIADEGLESEVFVPYAPTILIRGAKPHHADIAESASLR